MLFLQAKPPPPLENMNLQRDNAASHELFGLQHQRRSQANTWNLQFSPFLTVYSWIRDQT